jgi:hypothetical protein
VIKSHGVRGQTTSHRGHTGNCTQNRHYNDHVKDSSQSRLDWRGGGIVKGSSCIRTSLRCPIDKALALPVCLFQKSPGTFPRGINNPSSTTQSSHSASRCFIELLECQPPIICTMLVASRTLLRSRCLFSRGCATSRTARSSLFLAKAPHVQRQFASSPGRWQETIETPSQGPEVPLTASSTGPTESHLRSVAVLRLPLEATRSEIEALFKGKGLEMYVASESLAIFEQPV